MSNTKTIESNQNGNDASGTCSTPLNCYTFFHFTSRYHVKHCVKHGLILGVIPLKIDPPELLFGYQWLTKNPNYSQAWNEYSSLPYDRTEYRLTIKIPKKQRHNIFNWLQCGRKIVTKEMFETSIAYGDPENWYIFKGKIKPQWIKGVDHNVV